MQAEYAKHKEDTDAGTASLRQEISLLAAQLQKAQAESAEYNDRSSPNTSNQLGQSTQGQDVLKIVEDYSRQIE